MSDLNTFRSEDLKIEIVALTHVSSRQDLVQRHKAHLGKIVKIQSWYRRYVTRKKMAQAQLEYTKIFNSIEFDLNVHRIASQQKAGGKSNLL